ncbi:MAG: hypothetical protein LBJ14_06950 [Desulfarculales bacterium]|jgi:hypothetical protein|nr:hypothetical protein [Desulfarculales bacterium]
MGVRRKPVFIAAAGLVFPGLGQLLLGQKIRGIIFFALGNILFLTAAPLLAVKLYRAGLAVPPAAPGRWLLIKQYLAAGGLEIFLILGAAYAVLLLAGALSAYRSARLRRPESSA